MNKKNICFFLLIIIQLLHTSCLHSLEQEPYNSIVILPEDLHGWFPTTNKQHIIDLIKKHNPQVLVELGSWLGLSTVCLAEFSSETARVYAIDDWTADTDSAIQHDTYASKKLPTLYQQFLSNMCHKKVAHKVIPLRMKTIEAAAALSVTPDFIYVDASHDEESVYTDITLWYPKLAVEGILCGDDWDCTDVQKAVKRASKQYGQSITSHNNFWTFAPKK